MRRLLFSGIVLLILTVLTAWAAKTADTRSDEDALADADGQVVTKRHDSGNGLHIDGSDLDAGAFKEAVGSTKRWKNVRQLEGALDLVRQLRGVRYEREGNAGHGIGLIVEEVGEVIPESMMYKKNGIDAREFHYEHLMGVLIEGMKDQQKQIEAQEAAIARQIRMIERQQVVLEAMMKQMEVLKTVSVK